MQASPAATAAQLPADPAGRAPASADGGRLQRQVRLHYLHHRAGRLQAGALASALLLVAHLAGTGICSVMLSLTAPLPAPQRVPLFVVLRAARAAVAAASALCCCLRQPRWTHLTHSQCPPSAAVPRAAVCAPQGVLRTDGSGKAEFEANFSCIVMRPFKGEIMDCVVTSVNNMGFFADAGPLVIFVSSHLIPEDLTYTAIGSDSSFANADQSVRIVEGTHVRLRIVGARIDQQDIFCIGTIKEDYLGVIGTLV